MRINPIEKQKLERQYGVWEIKGSNPFTDPGYEVNCEEDEYLIQNGPSIKQISVFILSFFVNHLYRLQRPVQEL